MIELLLQHIMFFLVEILFCGHLEKKNKKFITHSSIEKLNIKQCPPMSLNYLRFDPC